MSDDASSAERPRTSSDEWQRNNDAYLSAALHWLRVRLGRMIATPEPAPAPPEAPPPRGWRFRRGEKAKLPLALPSGAPAGSDLGQAAARLAAAEAVEPPPALIILGRRLGLSRFEQETLLLCAAVELDTGIASLCAGAQQDADRGYPTFALALALFDEPAWEVLSPQRPLRYWRLIEINQPGAQPLTTSPLRADERVVNYLKGLNYLDDRLTPLLAPFDVAPDEALPPSQSAASATVERTIRQAAPSAASPLVQLVGVDPLSKQLVAQQACRALALSLYRLPAELLPQQAAELETLARLWHRESVLLPLALFLDAHEYDTPSRAGDAAVFSSAAPLQRFLNRSQGVFLLSTREIRSGLQPMIHAVDVGKPTPAEQRAAWAEALGEDARESPEVLAGQFDLNAFAIRQIVRTARAETTEDDLRDRLWAASLKTSAPRMDRLAQRLDPLATWGDIVLPDDQLALLRQLVGQVAQRLRVYDGWGFRRRMNRGLGISALFTGESGSGKTMAAEVIANELKLNLYRIDLSAVVSKYIGETEKNLRQLFDAAEEGGAILFFDEADALFGKRSEVRDSHDRYANIEINYLLQRMEAYRGLAILATNMRSALDEAFLRRLRFVVTFPFPGTVQRSAIWRRAWPAETPLGELDYARLARLSLTGGNIANVALNAAFMAAERGSSVTMPLVLAAARSEYEKIERSINEADFVWEERPRSALRSVHEREAEVVA